MTEPPLCFPTRTVFPSNVLDLVGGKQTSPALADLRDEGLSGKVLVNNGIFVFAHGDWPRRCCVCGMASNPHSRLFQIQVMLF